MKMMTSGKIFNLANRGVLCLEGKEVVKFLQGLVTNDVRRLENGKAQYALILNHRGRIVEDLILYRQAGGILIESDRKNQSKLRKLLEMYKMHKDVTISESSLSVYHAECHTSIAGVVDPRVPSFGKRILSETIPTFQLANETEYTERRFEFGIPEGPGELAEELPLFMNADIMNGVSTNKGCYLGQELTAQALNAPEIRKRALPFRCPRMVHGSLISSEGRREGKVVACNGRKGLALVPFSRIDTRKHFRTESDEIEIFIPSWWPINYARVSPHSMS